MTAPLPLAYRQVWERPRKRVLSAPILALAIIGGAVLFGLVAGLLAHMGAA